MASNVAQQEITIRTTADIVEHAMYAMDNLAEQVPAYTADAEVLRGVSQRLSQDAGNVGRVGRPNR